jgi:hypothetical protein
MDHSVGAGQWGKVMLKAVGFIVVLAVGLATGYVAKTYQETLAEMTIIKSNNRAEPLTESYQLCKTENSSRESALVIKSEGGHAKEMVFPWHGDAEVFRVDQINDLHYIATAAVQSGTEGPSTLDLNRVSGDLEVVSRYSDEAVKLLADICEKRVPGDQCGPLMEKLGGNVLNCFSVDFVSDCKKWTSGNNFIGRYKYVCRRAEQKF